MRDLTELRRYRRTNLEVRMYGQEGNAGNGMFRIESEVDGGFLNVIASDAGGWDHVSVSRNDRCPTWVEMQQIAILFFAELETAMQLHVPMTDHVNVHPNCLHWWRPNRGKAIPRPPSFMVG